MLVLVVIATLIIAFSNGANDNFKGVATLFGSGTTNYTKALTWATLCTLLGSIAAFFLSGKLIKTFSGKGLVDSALAAQPEFLLAVILGAGLTVLFASRFGIPISTTHSLTGALVGAGIAAVGMNLHFAVLGKKFFLPLLISPIIAFVSAFLFYKLLCVLQKRFPLEKESCVCVGERRIPVGQAAFTNGQVLTVAELKQYDIMVESEESCEAKAIQSYAGKLFGISVQSVVDSLHFLSAGAVSFARGLNDTPKIVALSVAAGVIGLQSNILAVAFFMALGGCLMARRVAETMSLKITPMSHGQGLLANLVTSYLVIVASRMGVPVSTTHVSCGSIFGIGVAGQKAEKKIIDGILGAWVLTLPTAALLAYLIYSTL